MNFPLQYTCIQHVLLLSFVVTLSTGLIAGIVVVCAVVILLTFLAGCGGGVIAHVVYMKKSKQSTGVWCVVCARMKEGCS